MSPDSRQENRRPARCRRPSLSADRNLILAYGLNESVPDLCGDHAPVWIDEPLSPQNEFCPGNRHGVVGEGQLCLKRLSAPEGFQIQGRIEPGKRDGDLRPRGLSGL